ncbi:class-II fumarase/aspartase family protein [Salinisphaera hydrothermalis]|uniref:Fumarate lyase n=1 Tax=Salinisphaera hydrothermalis (strain C41B8) TaxID=1304275 RepID=A0A084IG79_SALHC|nr:adenylosuccinate lyase family protein [Salinisphaera hydrothermalis]KEZ75713.1 fumarate lyase [Salinisphaera hydrothermalis C41B8]
MSQPPDVAAIRDLFSDTARHQSWLEVEAALAATQAELGMIPVSAAERITACAHLEALDMTAYAERAATNHAPVLALVETLAEACGPEAGAYVHWGGTTQNIIQTARIRQMHTAHRAVLQRLGRVFAGLGEMADTGADMLIAGRSNRRQGLPVTFGFKVAAWIEEMLRHEQRLREAEPRVFVAQFGGAIGAMHAFGEHGPALNEAIATRLGLGWMRVPSRAALDHIAEYIQLLALLATTASKIANEFYVLMTDEIAEVLENLDGAVGSSTMPQKVNSKIGVRVIALATQLRGQAATLLDAMQPSHEGDAATNITMYAVIDRAVPLAYELITLFEQLVASIELDPARMRHNVEASGGLIAAENAMMTLAATIGRQAAHDLVHRCAARARDADTDFATALCNDPELPAEVDIDALRAALDPAQYTGQSTPMARWAVGAATEASRRLG